MPTTAGSPILTLCSPLFNACPTSTHEHVFVHCDADLGMT